MKHALVVAVLLVSCSLFGQSRSGSSSTHSGWSFDDTLQTATDIVVADIVKGGGIDNGSQVSAKAEIRVVRALKGDLTTGAPLSLAWTYQPMPFEPPSASARMPLLRALWFLRKTQDGGYDPLLAAGPGSFEFGGYYVEVPSGLPLYDPRADVQTRLAAELAAAIENLAVRHAADLEPKEPVRDFRQRPEWVRTRGRFTALTFVLGALDKAGTTDVYRRFSGSEIASLKLVGLKGRLATGDAEAFCALEQDLPRLAGGYGATGLGPGPGSADVARNLRAGHCLGRLALADVAMPGFEGMAAHELGRSKRPEFLPYLIALLASPDAYARGSAIIGLCQANGRQPVGSVDCPNSAPNPDAERERQGVEYWKQWWADNREQIAKKVTLPDVGPPARFATTRPGRLAAREMPIEFRFEGLLGMTSALADHSHDSDGRIVPEPPPVTDPVAAKLEGADLELWREISAATTAKLAQNDQRGRELMNAGRLRGTMPSPEEMGALYRERLAILKAALDRLQSRLSPDGWKAVLDSMPGGASPPRTALRSAPRPRKDESGLAVARQTNVQICLPLHARLAAS